MTETYDAARLPKHGQATVRGIRHLSECLVAMYPDQEPDERCTCWDDSPDWD